MFHLPGTNKLLLSLLLGIDDKKDMLELTVGLRQFAKDDTQPVVDVIEQVVMKLLKQYGVCANETIN
jgi:hypothetical protein